jgi:hypothetical protein
MALRTGLAVALVAAAALGVAARPQAHREIPPAIGPYIDLKPDAFANARSFRGDDKIVMTHDFYWYDVASKAHIIDGDGTDALTTHPATMDDFSYKSVAWHKKQLSDMIEAGIDVVLPVYWGAPSDHAPGSHLAWSFEGLSPLARAAQELIREGKKPPKIGLFYDTTTLRHNAWGVHVDLTTDFGRRWFYASIRDFFSLIPPELWAMIDGRPIVVLYSASFAKAHDQSCIDYVKSEFPRQFGGRVPYIIREVSWRVKADDVCAWGGAIKPNFAGGNVAEIGPGYDHSAVPGRAPLIVPREDGKFYERAWQKVLRRSPRVVILETWNEFHEGTSLAESREHGRFYIELTRKYAQQFKRGVVPPAPEGPFTGASSVAVELGKPNRERGIKQVEHEDGRTAPAVIAGRPCRESRPGRRGERYLYFKVDDSFKWARAMDLVAAVEYLDDDAGSFTFQYDSHDPSATLDGAYKDCADRVSLAGTRTWKTARFALHQARFEGLQNAGADFRIAVAAPEYRVARVALRRADAAGTGEGRP